MTRLDYVQHLLNILAYDTLIDYLSIADRYWLHREVIANQNNVLDDAIVNDASGEILLVSENLINKSWQRPELRYNSDRELEVFDQDKTYWKKFEEDEYL